MEKIKYEPADCETYQARKTRTSDATGSQEASPIRPFHHPLLPLKAVPPSSLNRQNYSTKGWPIFRYFVIVLDFLLRHFFALPPGRRQRVEMRLRGGKDCSWTILRVVTHRQPLHAKKTTVWANGCCLISLYKTFIFTESNERSSMKSNLKNQNASAFLYKSQREIPASSVRNSRLIWKIWQHLIIYIPFYLRMAAWRLYPSSIRRRHLISAVKN